MKYGTRYLFDYLERVGKYNFDEVNFSIIDSLILTNLSYYQFNFMKDKLNEVLTIEEASHIYFMYPELTKLADQNTPRNHFLDVLATTKRFRNLKIFNYQNEISTKKEKQFSAISIKLNKDTVYVSFSGTDLTLVGWKEDFNMCYLNKIPSQVSAKKYIDNPIYNKYKNIYIGGHSKGGNLAMYSALNANIDLQNKIKNVFNFDGPGFPKLEINEENEGIYKKIIMIVPSMSIIGMIFNDINGIYVIESSARGLEQHDLFSWIITKENKFNYGTYLSNKSKGLNKAFNTYMTKLPLKERKEFINICYFLIENNNAKDLIEFRNNLMKSYFEILKNYNKLDSKEKDLFKKHIRYLIKIIKNDLESFEDKENSVYIKNVSKFDYFPI